MAVSFIHSGVSSDLLCSRIVPRGQYKFNWDACFLQSTHSSYWRLILFSWYFGHLAKLNLTKTPIVVVLVRS